MHGGRSVVGLVDATDGQPLGIFWVDHEDVPGGIDDILLTLDGRLIVVAAETISSYDLDFAAESDRPVPNWRVSLEGRVRQASLVQDLDALYLCDDGRRIKKLSLDDGRLLWRSERLSRPNEEGLTVHLHVGSVIVSTDASVSAVDDLSGLTLWRGTTPGRPRFIQRILTQSYFVAVNLSPRAPHDEWLEQAELLEQIGLAPDEAILPEAEDRAYFYDHRNASGAIPPEGGVCNLGRLEEVRVIMAVDGALVIQTGSTLQAWTSRRTADESP